MHDYRIVTDNVSYGTKIARAANLSYDPNRDHNTASCRGDELLGGVIFRNYRKNSIEVHMAGFDPYWITRNMVWAISGYVFVQLKCLKALAFIEETNASSLAIAKKVGFIEDARIRDACDDGDLLILSLHKDDCRHLKVRPRTKFWG